MHKCSRSICFIIIVILSISLLSCAWGETGTEESSAAFGETLTGEMVPVAVSTELRVSLYGKSEAQYCWLGDDIYYLEDYEDEDGWTSAELYYQYGGGVCTRVVKRSVDGTGDAVILDETEGRYIFALFEGTEQSLAMLVTEPGEDTAVRGYSLIRMDLSGKELARTELTDLEAASYITQAAMDASGNVAYIVARDGGNGYDQEWCYLILADGICVNDLEIGDGDVSAKMSVLNLGEQGLNLTEQYSLLTSGHRELKLWKINFEEKCLTQEGSTDVSEELQESVNIPRILTDGSHIYLSSYFSLCICDPESGEKEEVLDWSGAYVNVNGSQAAAVRSEDGEYQILLAIDADPAKIVTISFVDSSLLTPKQTITVATSGSVSLASVVQRFNESSTEYYVVLVNYSSSEMADDLIYHPKETPDVFDMRHLDVQLLVGLDLMEDLEPYFEASDVVSRDDLLDTVWEAGFINGKMVGVITEFRIGTLYTSAEGIPVDGWTIDDLIDLCEEYPESDLIAWYSYEDILEIIAMTGGLDEYVDWETLECSFDSEGFISLMEKLTLIRYPETDDAKVSYGSYAISDAFLAQESLLANSPDIYCPMDYYTIKTSYGAKTIVGYPTVTGEEPWYELAPIYQFGIYSNSEHKDGAWAFIEFLLSESEQTWYASDVTGHHHFPVRKDAFAAFLERRYSVDASLNYKESPGEDAQALTDMVEHAHLKSRILETEIWDIILEEIQYYYEGAKSSEEVAQLIQNRAQLYLSELE